MILLSLAIFAQQKKSISGFVYDKSTGEILIGATILCNKMVAVTNEYGFYSIEVPVADEEVEVTASFVGYKHETSSNKDLNKKQTDFHLTPGVNIESVTVVAQSHQDIVHNTEMGVTRLSMKAVKQLPNLFGEVDIIKAFQLTPGVQSGGEANSNLYVRGGSPDQNLFLLDDVPLYYVAHFGGFFSVFNADAINDVKLVKGGFPARYGGRLSSVLDIRMKEGNSRQFKGQGTVGLLSSKISVEGPIIKDKLSFIVSARKRFLPILKIMGSGLSSDFYDLNAKLNYRLSEKDRFFLSFYTGDDIVSSKIENVASKHKSTVKWGNTLLAFRWNHLYGSTLFSNITLATTRYRYVNHFEYQVETGGASQSVDDKLLTGVKDVNFKADFSWIPNSILNIKFGLNSVYHTFIPNDVDYKYSRDGADPVSKSYRSVEYSTESAAYIENEFSLNRLKANIGMRFSSYFVDGLNDFSANPRVLLNYVVLDNLSLKYSFSQMRQYVHLLTYSGTGNPADYWMPANKNVQPGQSVQHSAGVSATFGDESYSLSAEVYHKSLGNLITFVPGESLSGNLDSWENVVEKNGEGTNYGLELFLKKQKGKTTGWIGATMARAERVFENINGGKPYPYKYDRLLDLSIVANHKLKENIDVSASWTYGSGYPLTLATQHYSINEADVFVYSDKNAFRMRDYHRLDIAANFHKTKKWGRRTWTISIFNVYNRKNPYYYYYDRESSIEMSDNTNGVSLTEKIGALKLYQRSLFSFFPSVSYSFEF